MSYFCLKRIEKAMLGKTTLVHAVRSMMISCHGIDQMSVFLLGVQVIEENHSSSIHHVVLTPLPKSFISIGGPLCQKILSFLDFFFRTLTTNASFSSPTDVGSHNPLLSFKTQRLGWYSFLSPIDVAPPNPPPSRSSILAGTPPRVHLI